MTLRHESHGEEKMVDRPALLRHDTKMLEAWACCVEFNDKYSVGSKITLTDNESQKTVEAITTTPAYVINDVPVVQTHNRQFRLSQLVG